MAKSESGVAQDTQGMHTFSGRNLRWLLESRVALSPDKEALVWRDFAGANERWTYRSLVEQIDRVAGGLDARGISTGDRVLLCMGNCPEFIILWFALASLGAVTVAINNRSTAPELRDFLQRTNAKLAIGDRGSCEVLKAAAAQSDIPLLFVRRGADGPAPDNEPDEFAALAASPALAVYPEVAPHLPAMIQFTSGTTSRPKGVVWTQANLLWGGKVSSSHESLTPDDRHLVMLPLFHTNAQSYSVLASLWAGATVILLPRFSTSRFWPISLEERATWCSITGFGIKALLTQPVPPRHSYRCFGSGAITDAWQRHVGVSNIAWWGMTETVTHGIVSDVSLPSPNGSMGYPAPEYELRLMSEDGRPLQGPGTGLLEIRGVRGESMALEYLDDPKASAAAWHSDGWFRTGDRVAVRTDGSLFFIDREKDVIRVGGENVAALEVEGVIKSLPEVSDAAVVALPHEMLQEVAVAFVVTDSPRDRVRDDVLKACRENLADFKRPRHVFFVDELPKGLLDKVLKKDLRESAVTLTQPQ